jgi:ABC-type transport system substrate-binding protein
LKEERSFVYCWARGGEVPYSETAPASIGETFKVAVLGQLFKRDAAFNLQPGLVRKWRWDFERNLYILTLRDDIVFHNGRPATASDLEFAILRGFFTQHRSFYKIFLNSNILGIENIGDATVFKSGLVPGVKVIDAYTLELKLKTPNPNFLDNFTNAYFSLVPKETLKDDYINWKDFPIGAGPYKLVSQDLGESKFVLEKANGQIPSAPKHVSIFTKAKPVAYDIVAFLNPQTSIESYEERVSTYADSVWGLLFFIQNPLGGDPHFRKAIQYAINRKSLLSGFDQYIPTLEMLPMHMWGRTGIKDSYDLEKARELIRPFSKKWLQKTWPIPV